MIKSLRYRILVWFLAFVALIILISIPINSYYSKKRNEITGIVNHIHFIYRDLLKYHNNNLGFLQYETINSQYYENQENSRYIQFHDSLSAYINSNLETLKTVSKTENYELEDQIDSLVLEVERYNRIFDSIVDLNSERGFKDYGKVGNMRNVVHDLENTKGIDMERVLMLRRHEKDYLIRKEEQYIEKHRNVSALFKTEITSSPFINSQKKVEILDLIIRYHNLFDEVVELDNILGGNSTGLIANLDLTAKGLDNQFQYLIDSANKKRIELLKELKFLYVILSILLIAASILGSTLVIQKTTNPLKQLTTYISDLIKSDFKKSQEIDIEKADFEVKMIYDEFNNMVNKLDRREKQRDNALMALKENEIKFRELADLLPQSIYETDDLGNYTYVNKAWYKKFCYERIDLDLGLNVVETLISNNPEILLIDERVENEEITAIKKGGDKFPALVYSNKIIRNGKSIGNRGIVIDITDRKKYIEALKREKLKAEESDRLKSAFLANMSHEIRTPMNAIIGFSDLLVSNKNLSIKERENFVGHIRNSSELLLNLINDIIDIAKIEAGEIKINKTQCYVNEILDELLVTHTEQLKTLKKENIELIAEKRIKEDFRIKTDPFRLKQILSNLIGNAIKFTADGTISFGYTCSEEHYLNFYVEDTGIGLPEDKLDIIFERFRQVEVGPVRNYGGTGLGLSITKNLVDLLGGEIWVESKLNEGSTFHFTLPYKKIKKQDVIKHIVFSENIKYNWSGKTVLIAEDDQSNFNVINEYLKEPAPNIIHAKDGEEVIEICDKNEKIDLILMDIQMPKMNGYEATKLIKRKNPKLPIIAQTAYAMSGEKIKSKKAGCDDYISKPLNRRILFGKINYYLTNGNT